MECHMLEGDRRLRRRRSEGQDLRDLHVLQEAMAQTTLSFSVFIAFLVRVQVLQGYRNTPVLSSKKEEDGSQKSKQNLDESPGGGSEGPQRLWNVT